MAIKSNTQTWLIVGLTLCTLGVIARNGPYKIFGKAATSTTEASQSIDLSAGMVPKAIPYDAPAFSVIFPYGTHVVTKDDQGKNRHGKVYDGMLHGDGLNVTSVNYEDFLSERQTDITDAMLAGYANMLKPGYSESPVTDATLSDLPARELVARGIVKGTDIPVTVRLRMALSPDHIRVWLLFTMSDERRDGLSEADSNKFFDSFKIK